MTTYKVATSIYCRAKQANLAAMQAAASGSTALLPRKALPALISKKAKVGLQGLGAAELSNIVLKAEQAKRAKILDTAKQIQQFAKETIAGTPAPASSPRDIPSIAEVSKIKLQDIILDKSLRQIGEESLLANPMSTFKSLLGLS